MLTDLPVNSGLVFGVSFSLKVMGLALLLLLGGCMTPRKHDNTSGFGRENIWDAGGENVPRCLKF